MGAFHSFPKGAVERLAVLLEQASTKTEYQRVPAVWLRAALGLSALPIAPALGWQAQSVRQVHSEYFRHGEAVLHDKPKGGRHHENLTRQQEQELLAPFLDQAQAGGVLVVAPPCKRPRSRRWAVRFTRPWSIVPCTGKDGGK
jgi:hypothetical protein